MKITALSNHKSGILNNYIRIMVKQHQRLSKDKRINLQVQGFIIYFTTVSMLLLCRSCRSHDCMIVGSVQSVPITTKVVSSTPAHGEVYSTQHYVITFVSDLWQVCGFLRVP
jgi:hypothetical protein